MEVPDPFSLSHDDLHVLPVLHDRLECAAAVREAVDSLAPKALVVEIPSSLERAWRQAVARLPALSFVVFETAERETIYLPVQPADPMAEATRLAAERGLPWPAATWTATGTAPGATPFPMPTPSIAWACARCSTLSGGSPGDRIPRTRGGREPSPTTRSASARSTAVPC
jgi:hypothetical protein